MKASLIGIAILLITACGGGGGGGNSTAPPTTAPPPPPTTGGKTTSPDNSYFNQRSQYFEQHNASGLRDAYRRGWTGDGQKIVLVEPYCKNIGSDYNTICENSSAFDNGSEYNGRIGNHYISTSSGGLNRVNTAGTGSGSQHARMVSQLSIGKTYGIAPKAKADVYSIIEGTSFTITNVMNRHLNDGTVAISNSWGQLKPLSEFDYFKTDGANDSTKKRYYKDTTLEDLNNLKRFLRRRTGKGASFASRCKYSKDSSFLNFSRKYIKDSQLPLVQKILCGGIDNDKYTDSDFDRIHTGVITSLRNNMNALENGTIKDIPILVWAATNYGMDNPHISSAAIHREYLKDKKNGRFKNIADYWLAVANINANTSRLAPTSNKCGISWEYCISAYGKNTRISSDTYGGVGGGTSAATPIISGGLAVIKQAFPSKDNAWVRKRMLITARHRTADGKNITDRDGNAVKIYNRANTSQEITYNTNLAGLSKEFGAGIMRLDLATTPISSTFFSLYGTNLENSRKHLTKETQFLSHSMFGDGIKSKFDTFKTYHFDSMNAEFKTTLGNLTTTQASNTMNAYLDAPINTFDPTKIKAKQSVFSLNYAGVMRRGGRDIFYNKNNALPFSGTQDIALGLQQQKHTILTSFSQDTKRIATQITGGDYTAGVLMENDYMLGSKISGAFGQSIKTNTLYTSLNNSFPYKGWNLNANATYAMSKVNGLDGIIKNASTLYSSSFQFDATTAIKQGEVGFSLKQPLRLEKGSLRVQYVSSINSKNDLTYSMQDFNASPSGRQINLEAFFKPNNSDYIIRSFYIRDNGHIKGANDYGVFLQWSKEF